MYTSHLVNGHDDFGTEMAVSGKILEDGFKMSDASQSIPQDGSAPTSATISFGDVLEKVGNGP